MAPVVPILSRRGAVALLSSTLKLHLPALPLRSTAHTQTLSRPTNCSRSAHLPRTCSSSHFSPFSSQQRSVFTYPAPRKLTDIMKVPLVRRCEPPEIQVRYK